MRALTLPFLRIGKISLYLAVFLTPLFFLPFGQSVLGYPKQILLLLLVFLGFGGWLAHQHIQGKIVLRTNKRLYIAALVLFSTFSLSVVFSAWPAASLWGFPLSANDSLLALFVFLLLAFLVAHALKSEGDLSLGVFFLISSGALAGIFTLLQLWNLFVLPFDFAKISSFNILGNVEQAALFLAALLPLALILAFRASKLIFWIIAFILFASLLLIDLRSAWFVFALGLFALIIFGAARGQNGVKAGRIFVLMSLLVVVLFFLFFPLRPAIFPLLPSYVAPGTVAEFEILKGVWTEGVKGFLLGSGPGTFVFDYSKYRSPLLNLTTFWGTRFSSGSAEFLDWFVTKGFFGGLSLIGFLIVLIYEAIAGQRKAEHYSSLRLGFLASGAALIGAGLVAPFSFSLWFLFWLVVGGLLFYNSGLKEADLQKPAWRSVFSVVALLAAILLLGLFFLNLQKYAADLSYAKAVRFFQKGDIDGAIAALQKSTLLNSSADIYWRDLAQMYLLLTNSVVQDQGLSQERKNQLAQENIALGIQSLNQAVNRAKSNVANWNVRGFFYRSLIGIAGAQELALESYDRAIDIDLEPASLFAWGEKGRVYIFLWLKISEKNKWRPKNKNL